MCDALKGQAEYTLPDKTRVDCLTEEYAIGVVWANKWAEGVGQSIYYSLISHKKPAIALIMDKKSDERHYKRLNVVANKLNFYVIRIEQ